MPSFDGVAALAKKTRQKKASSQLDVSWTVVWLCNRFYSCLYLHQAIAEIEIFEVTVENNVLSECKRSHTHVVRKEGKHVFYSVARFPETPPRAAALC